jgi:hypothetical protein
MKKIINVLLIVSLLVAITSCEKDDHVVDLKLDNNTVELEKGGTATVIIEAGNGGYKVESDKKEVADASLSGTTITINALSEGDARITVTDAKDKTATITVKVDYTILTPSKFVWNGASVEFDKADKYGISVLSTGVALTDLITDKKQYLLSWDGGLTTGDKTNGKLVIAQSGKEADEVTLTSLKVILAETSGNYIMFNDGSKNGELFFAK